MWLQHGDLLVGQCFLNLQVMTTLKAAYHTFCTLDIHIMIHGSSKGTVRNQHWDFNWHQDKYAYGFEWRYILETSWMTSFGRKRNFWSVELGRIEREDRWNGIQKKRTWRRPPRRALTHSCRPAQSVFSSEVQGEDRSTYSIVGRG